MALLLSPDAMDENIRTLRQQGYSEAEAIARATKQTPETVTITPKAKTGRLFVVVTRDFSGLGWAKVLQDEGNRVIIATDCPEDDPDEIEMYDQVGEGWVERMPVKDAVRTLSKKQPYWVFAENICPEIADQLRSKGQRVFGTSKLSEKMEHDRHYAVGIANTAGLKSPLTKEFTTTEEGVTFLEAHPDQAFVFKPDDGSTNYSTFVPVREQDADANHETLTYLRQMTSDPGSYILQERVRGTEVDVEAWFYEGEPFMALITLEDKRKDDGNLGEMAGCASDVVWIEPVDSPLVQQTIGKMFDFYKSKHYTGFGDVNVILTDNGPRFLEVCDRFGYNSHVTLMLGLAVDPVGDILADFMDGRVMEMESHFRSGFGSSLTLFLDHPRPGIPVHVDPRWKDQWYPFDGYQEDDDYLLAGYSAEVGIFVDHGKTPESALLAVRAKLEDEEAVSFPDRYYRTDAADTDYPNSICRRHQELMDEGLLA
jgi:phosphoribosylamine--glycine ligase